MKLLKGKGYIYAHINKINGKVYIGQTIQNPNQRWRKGEGYKDSSYFYSAIQKYGWNNFEHIILEEGIETQEELNEKEIYWINYYKSTNEDFGYNLSPGGYLPLDGKAKERQIKAIREKVGRKVICLNTKQIYETITDAENQTGANHIAKCCMGELKASGQDSQGVGLVWRYLEEYNPEEKIEFTPQKRKKTKVLCINTGIVYDSTRQASNLTGIDNGSINKCCNGIRKSAGKDKNNNPLVWVFIDGDTNIENILSKVEIPKKNNLKVKCIETEEIFENKNKAAEWCGLSNGESIRLYLRGKQKSAGKHPETGEPLHWEEIIE